MWSCLNSTSSILSQINQTYVTLIPEVKNLELVTKFRHINLRNVIYKLLSKVLTNRLKKVLSLIILMSQSAFVSEHLIIDNILVNFETLHHIKIQNIRRKWFITVKLDMNKAYDMVEWVFLKQIMRQLSFHDKSITLMIECISIVSYSIMVNEELKGLIKCLGD